ncbi:trihelix transcription factor PTL-like [Pyrus communis]|uniref:trihelix transcription factor PTL-like n=1 Tax=Pyrus communis TaxID=23211 RepID=UPI0035BF215C
MDDYGPPDLRQLMASRTQFHTPLQFPEQFSVHQNLTPPPPPPPHYRHLPIMLSSEVVPSAGLLDNHRYTSMITTTACHPTTSSAASAAAALYGIEFEHGWNNIDGANTNNNSRWPRQETLTLLEIRSALDSKFKETNQKGPLWDEVSRIMAEEHGFQRTGKKCKEKFENLYKYYKKTKEGKTGRQDGKHYRFFRQLEAIYGNHHQSTNQSSVYSRPNPLLCHTTPSNSINRDQNQEVVVQDQKFISCESLSFSNNSTEFDQTSPSKNNDDEDSLSAIDYFPMNQSTGSLKNEKKSYATPVKKKWKAKVVDFMNSQMGKVIKTQEALMEKMVKSIEASADERIAKEEEWRKQEAAKYERDVHEFWAKERAWVETRDAAIMETLRKYTGKGTYNNSGKDDIAKEIGSDHSKNYPRWTEHEVASLIQLKTSLERTFKESEYLKEEGVWEEIAANMGSLGYTRSGGECKEKWENESVCFKMTTESNKMHKQDTKTNNTYFSQISGYEEGHEVRNQRQDGMGLQLMDEGLSPSCSNMDVNSSSLHIPFNGGENLWDERDSYVTNSLRNKRLLHW